VARKLIVCCDGTWNEPYQCGAPTNVVKMARAIRPVDDNSNSQIVWYHPGVGTGNAFDRFLGGTLGVGLSRNVRAAYGFLADNYQPGDAIFLFGFSRGAYTARSVAGLVSLIGLLQKHDLEAFPTAYEFYRRSPALRDRLAGGGSQDLGDELRRLFPGDEKTGLNRLLRDSLKRSRRTRIFFVGVWDTVGALGIPYGPLRFVGRRLYHFHDTRLGRNIRYAYQALALDEERRAYQPALWVKPNAAVQDSPAPAQTVEQVWFCGAHSNVGGGYPDAGLSDVAFLWMAAKAAAACDAEDGVTPLALDEDYLGEEVSQAMGHLAASRRRLWRLMPRGTRSPFAPQSEPGETFERIHRSALIRYQWNGGRDFEPFPYRPGDGALFEPPEDPAKIAEFSEFELRFRRWQVARDAALATSKLRETSPSTGFEDGRVSKAEAEFAGE
jgi:uncharacterized protein (DUF2235 family)